MAGFQLTLYGRIWVTPKGDEAVVLNAYCMCNHMFNIFTTQRLAPTESPFFALCTQKILQCGWVGLATRAADL